jgi:hypothetical protein
MAAEDGITLVRLGILTHRLAAFDHPHDVSRRSVISDGGGPVVGDACASVS